LLKESTTGSGASRIGHALRGGLVISEIAVAVILLFTSGILLRSLWAAETLNPGFEPMNLLALELQLPPLPYKSEGSILDFYGRLETTLRAQPGVESVGEVNCPRRLATVGTSGIPLWRGPCPADRISQSRWSIC
jgi:putative ABC transport system permease protein